MTENKTTPVPNDLESYWMPFTANRQFKADPRLLARAKDMHYFMADGREILDGTAGLWCVNAGHCRDDIADAIAAQAHELDYATAFQMGHPKALRHWHRVIWTMCSIPIQGPKPWIRR